MDNKDIRELAALMREMGLTSISYRSGTESIKLTRPPGTATIAEDAIASGASVSLHHDYEGIASVSDYAVKSPMVGVFYCAPGVGEAPFVSLGDIVTTGDVLCVIEAMKIMNEITAERDGVITEICVENKDIVEFGTTLFRIGDDEQ